MIADNAKRDEMLAAFREAVRQGGDSTDDIRWAGIEAVLELVSDCQACPRDCRQCTTDEESCGCYEHEHPRDKAEKTIRYLVDLIESKQSVDVAEMRGLVLAQGWTI